MDLRDILRICFSILSLCLYAIGIIMSNKEWKKARRELEKQDETEILKKETQEIIVRGHKFLLIGVIPATIFQLIALLILHGII